MLCPDCESKAVCGKKTNGDMVTLKIKCTKCNRKVIRTGKRKEYNTIYKHAVTDWNSVINSNLYGTYID